jgi:hypothetical protein
VDSTKMHAKKRTANDHAVEGALAYVQVGGHNIRPSCLF